MLHIEIHFPRPLLTLGLIAAAVFLLWHHGSSTSANVAGAEGGDDVQAEAMAVHNAEDDIKKVREQQSVLDHQEQILRAELAALESELAQTQDQTTAEQLVQTREQLLALLSDRRANEQQILESLKQIWDAQGAAVNASEQSPGTIAPGFEWPVNPALGISATFHDPAYFKKFGMQHQAIDIPVEQGSVVHAAADGIVAKVSDNGMGYSSLVISHNGGYATLYGHVSGFLVHEGDQVHAGQGVALSGGTPGTKGAGHMTTGAHLHFELIKDGTHVDPLTVLPTLVH